MEQDQTDPLEGFLADLAGAGSHDSRGAFTIDLHRALEKLGRFCHPDPAMAVRHLFTAAILLEGRSFHLRTRPFTLEFDIEGPHLSLEEMKEIFPSLSRTPPGRRGAGLRELGMALTNLRNYKDIRLRMESGEAELEMDPRRLYIHHRRHGFFDACIKVVVKRLGLFERWCRPELDPSHQWAPEPFPALPLREVLEATAGSKVERLLNGRPVRHSWDWRCQALSILRGMAHLPEMPEDNLLIERETGEEYSMVVGLYPGRVTPVHGNVSILHQGLLFQEMDPAIPVSCRILISDDGLKRDLLGTNLVQDGRWDRLLRSAREALCELAARVLEADTKLSDRVRSDLIDSWQTGELPEADGWRGLPFLQLGGWEHDVSVEALEKTYATQGWIQFDPQTTPGELVTALVVHMPNQYNPTPYEPLPALEEADQWMVRVPLPRGEVRYRRAWPGEPARALVEGQRLEGPLPLPLGLEVVLDFAPVGGLDSELPALRERLAKTMATVAELNPERFHGSPAALRLALWLAGDTQQGRALRRHFTLRSQSGEGCPLERVLSADTMPYALAGDQAPVSGVRNLLLLSETERDLLQEQGCCLMELLPPTEIPSLLRKGHDGDQRVGVLLEYLTQLMAAERGAALRLRPGGGVLERVAGVGIGAYDALDSLVVPGNASVNDTLLQLARSVKSTVLAASSPVPQHFDLNERLRALRSCLAYSLAVGGDGPVYVFYLERPFRSGVFGPVHLEALDRVGQHAAHCLPEA